MRPEPTGSATYTQSSRLQAAGLSAAVALLKRAAEQVRLPAPPQPIVVADYGAANGHNSLKPISETIAVLRRRTRHDHAILLAHTDIPENDFTALFRNLDEDPDSYLHTDSACFASAIGRSFYAQIVPSNTVNLGWSSWAVQWLSRVPCEFDDHVHIGYSRDRDAHAAYTHQAAIDWHNFVAFRGRELVPQGRLVVLTHGVDQHGGVGLAPLLEAIRTALTDQARDGLLHPDELARMAVPSVARSEKDLRAPFLPSGRFEGLTVEHLEMFDADDRFWARLQIDGDASAFGAQWAAFARAAMFPALVCALDGATTDPRAGEFVDWLEAAVAERLSAGPEPMRIPLALLALVKRP